jgi:hypothetical protein
MDYTRRKFVKDIALGVLGFSGLSAFGAVVPEITASGKQNKLVTDDIILYQRSVWADFKPRLNRLRKASGFNKITIHHSGSTTIYHTNRNSVICDIDAVYTSHMNRNYGDIGYHFIIDYAGRIWEGRSLSYEGAHVCHYNKGNIGIMLLGNFENQKPSELQLSSMKKITNSLKKKYAVKSKNIYGHRDIGQSLCPGKNLYPYVAKLRV